ncbi:MAG TPA: HAMP domain-containing sensor histidine kinase [Acidimicrobiia bacterium]
MTKPTRRLRTRLLVAIMAIALGVVVLTALVTAGLAHRTATSAARDDVARHAPVVADEFNALLSQFPAVRLSNQTAAGRRQVQRIRDLVATTLRASNGAIVAFDAGGQAQEVVSVLLGVQSSLVTLPQGVTIADLDVNGLLAGTTQRGTTSDTVFMAIPLDPVRGLTPVVVLAEHVSNKPFGNNGGVVLGAAVIALVIAAFVGFYLARRMTRPLAAMETTARQIAGGDLSARVDDRRVSDDELGSLAHAINAMAGELEAAQGHERAFLLSVSHDLRTPLTSIRGYADAIVDGTVEGTEARLRAAEVIGTEARRLERLVADLLDLARLDAHQFSLHLASFDARDVVSDTVDAFRPAAADIGVELAFAADAPAPARADSQRLAQIIANLVENALKYASAKVAVHVEPRDDRIEIHVDDDGPGIAPVDLPHVFERLYTSRTVPGRVVGTGIGLAIVHELASAMGGTTRVEPIDSTGTRFVVTIPANLG